MFLVYGGDKELVVNGYVDASFDTDPHSVHLKTEPKNHTENKPNRTDFIVFMVSGFGMVWTFHTVLNFGLYGIYRETERLTE